MTRGGAFLITGLTALLAGVSPARADSCVRVAKPLAASTAPVAGDFEPADCAHVSAASAFRYDGRTVRSARVLAVGEVLRQPPSFALAAVRPGDKLVIRVQAGPVVVQRTVEALQAARSGDRLFVKADDGAVFSVPFEGTQP